LAQLSAIEWTDATWNPVTGCDKVSTGCKHCYAETRALRLQKMGQPRYRDGFKVTLHPDKLDEPLRWRKPRRVFVNSMSDLFHEDVDGDFLTDVWETMAACPQHIFQVLTKRPERAREFLSLLMAFWVAEPRFRPSGGPSVEVPPRNIWLGVSVENQKAADERIPLLLETPAAVRFLSCEPLLGPIEFLRPDFSDRGHGPGWLVPGNAADGPGIDWVIAGGESGLRHRPCDPDWVRGIRDQCVAAGVPFFFKQWGGRIPKAGGRTLDGRTWDEMPPEGTAT